MSNTAADRLSAGRQAAVGSAASSIPRSRLGGGVAAAAWLAAALLTGLWPDLPESDWAYTGDLAIALGAIAVAISLGIVAGIRFADFRRLQTMAPWLVALAL